MARVLLAILMVAGCFLPAFADEYFDERFAPGYDLLEEGEFDQALAAFNELKIELPDSALVDYSIASTYYAMALRQEGAEQKEGRIENYTRAREQFNELANMPDTFLRENAPFSAANCSAQLAKQYDPGEEYVQRLQGLKTAISEFDGVLRLDPDHRQARQNRDHLNYLLKQMLQNPPPDQQKEDESDDGDESNEGDNEQEGDDSSESDEEKENKDEEDNAQGDQNNQDENAENDPESGEVPQQDSENGKTAEEENIEALLESLEDVNKEEQKNLRRSNRLPQVKGGKWW